MGLGIIEILKVTVSARFSEDTLSSLNFPRPLIQHRKDVMGMGFKAEILLLTPWKSSKKRDLDCIVVFFKGSKEEYASLDAESDSGVKFGVRLLGTKTFYHLA